MTKALKSGYLLRYKRRLFSRYWREEFIVLYEDSSIAWYKDKSRPVADGAVLLKEAPELMAIGEYTERIPQRPSSLPRGCSLGQVMAFGTRNRQKVHWFVAKSEEEVSEWMTAISNTLPLPPQLPVYADIDDTTANIYETIDLQHRGHLPATAAGANQPLVAANGATNKAVTCQPNNSNNGAPVSSTVGEMTTGVMLATGFTTWGWGYGLGWSKPALNVYSANGYDTGVMSCDLDAYDSRYQLSSSSWIHNDMPSSGSGHNYYDDCHDNDFDMDFGGDFGF